MKEKVLLRTLIYMATFAVTLGACLIPNDYWLGMSVQFFGFLLLNHAVEELSSLVVIHQLTVEVTKGDSNEENGV